MKYNARIVCAAALLAALTLTGCGGKSNAASAKAGATPAQTTAEGERVSADRAQHYQQASSAH